MMSKKSTGFSFSVFTLQTVHQVDPEFRPLGNVHSRAHHKTKKQVLKDQPLCYIAYTLDLAPVRSLA